ncbi:MAG TPA: (Fe-S)-binding protein, partial [Longimicrobiales bacterium]
RVALTVVDATENCRHCLMCRHVCPVGNLTRREVLTPHGWAQLVALERRGLLSWGPETVDRLYRCADCGSCRAHCVGDQALPEAIAAARAALVDRGIAPPAVYEIGRRLREWENPYVDERPRPVAGRGEVALFVGDEAEFLRPSVVVAALDLLEAVGVRPVLIGRGRSSGQLASSLGLLSVGRDLAAANLAELEATGARRLFVLSPGDFFAFTRVYGERLGVPLPAGVEVEEVVLFLARQLEAGRLRLRPSADVTPYAYVDPTHAVRVAGRAPAPRRLLSAVLPRPLRELFWRGERAQPCGDVALEFTHPALADALTRARLADAVRAGARGLITEAPGTLVRLERHATLHDVRVEGLYEFLAEHLAR